MAQRSNPIYRALNRPLTILGAERKQFFVAVTMGATVFNLLNSLLGGPSRRSVFELTWAGI